MFAEQIHSETAPYLLASVNVDEDNADDNNVDEDNDDEQARRVIPVTPGSGHFA